MATCTAVGTNALLLVEPRAALGDADPTFDVNSERYPFLYETMGARRPKKFSKMIFGDRSRLRARNYHGSYVPKGSLGLQLGPAELDLWLPRMTGGTPSGDSFPLGNVYPFFDMMIYLDDVVTYYRACQVAAWVMHSEESNSEDDDEILNTQLIIICRSIDHTKSLPGTLPAVTEGAVYTPYIHPQLTLTLDSVVFEPMKWRLICDNGLRPKNRNSLTPTCVYEGPRVVRMESVLPFTDDIWTVAKDAYTETNGLTGSANFTSSTLSLNFDFNSLHNTEEPPSVRGHEEIPFELKLEAAKVDASNLEMEITSDATV